MIMSDNFMKCHELTARMEGGYSDDPADAGGVTNWGICLRFLKSLEQEKPEFLESMGIALPVTRATIKGLSKDQAANIFHHEMWKPYRLDEYPLPVAQCVYDMNVNHGVTGGVRIAQQAYNRFIGKDVLVVDGKLGPKTAAALSTMSNEDGINAFEDARMAFYDRLIIRRPSQKVFEKGWKRRCHEMADAARSFM